MKTTQSPKHRAKDPIAKLMTQYLDVPVIFFDAPWPNKSRHVDILAIDRAGSGDVHVIEIVKDLESGIKRLPQLLKIPAQYRWLAYLFDAAEDLDESIAEDERAKAAPLYAANDMGRVGVIHVASEEDQHGQYLYGEVVVRAERFRGSNYEDTKRFVDEHAPDVDFR